MLLPPEFFYIIIVTLKKSLVKVKMPGEIFTGKIRANLLKYLSYIMALMKRSTGRFPSREKTAGESFRELARKVASELPALNKVGVGAGAALRLEAQLERI